MKRNIPIGIVFIASLVFADTTTVDPNSLQQRANAPMGLEQQIEFNILSSLIGSSEASIDATEVIDDLLDGKAQREAQWSIPKEQRNRKINIDPQKSRGPFPITVYPGHLTILAFVDSYGDPWPLTGQPVNPNDAYTMSWSQDSAHIVQVDVDTKYIQTSIGIMLKGKTLPLTFNLLNGKGIQDVSLVAEVLGISPTSTMDINSTIKPQIVLPILNDWINGVIPESAQSISLSGGTDTQAWEFGATFILATTGTPVYPDSPFATASASDNKTVFYAYKTVPDAIAVRYSNQKPIVLGVN
jgi:hypothetical protein